MKIWHSNPYVVEHRPPERVDLHIARVLLYLHREIQMSQTALHSSLVVIVAAWFLHSWSIAVIGVSRFLIDSASRRMMRRLRDTIELTRDPQQQIERRRLFYVLVGISWGTLTWPMLLTDDVTGIEAIMFSVGILSTLLMSTSQCYVSPLFTSTTAGFSAAVLFPSLFGDTRQLVLILVGLPVLQLMNWDLARGTLAQYTGMLEAQHQRDDALDAQRRTIDELDQARRHAHHLAATDSVTMLPNRSAILDWIDARIAHAGGPFTLLLMDLDFFKNINDTMGHHVGDALLVAMGRTLRGYPDGDDGPDDVAPAGAPQHAAGHRGPAFAARLGGDEFAVVLAGHHEPAELDRMHERWLARLAQLHVDGIGVLAVSSTCGSAAYPADAIQRTALLNSADLALRGAKAARRGSRRSYDGRLAQSFSRETRIAALLSRAIEENQFAVYLQPQVRIDDGTLVAAEILTRFTGAELKSFSVQDVFDTAEERGLGSRLADSLLRKAGDALRQLHQSLPETVVIGVNLSRSSLKHTDQLVVRLHGWIADGVDPRRVKLEITEDALSGRGLDGVRRMLDTVVQLGYSLSLDDFGTGQSSLQHLHSLPIGELKIAKQFIDRVDIDRKDQAIVRSAVVMCEHLGIDCVIEGVETEAQLRMVRTLGAQLAQGYYWARPVTLQQFLQRSSPDAAAVAVRAAAAEATQAGD